MEKTAVKDAEKPAWKHKFPEEITFRGQVLKYVGEDGFSCAASAEKYVSKDGSLELAFVFSEMKRTGKEEMKLTCGVGLKDKNAGLEAEYSAGMDHRWGKFAGGGFVFLTKGIYRWKGITFTIGMDEDGTFRRENTGIFVKLGDQDKPPKDPVGFAREAAEKLAGNLPEIYKFLEHDNRMDFEREIGKACGQYLAPRIPKKSEFKERSLD